MTKSDLMKLVGKKVLILFKDGGSIYGTLCYVDEFCEKTGYRKPKYFYIASTAFNVSHVKKVIESEVSE